MSAGSVAEVPLEVQEKYLDGCERVRTVGKFRSRLQQRLGCFLPAAIRSCGNPHTANQLLGLDTGGPHHGNLTFTEDNTCIQGTLRGLGYRAGAVSRVMPLQKEEDAPRQHPYT